ncbi:MAG TPA: hypothetical protein VES66_09265 [Terriglobales bacterium]|nr:hypothetical protein [Terriglobales bacterium]
MAKKASIYAGLALVVIAVLFASGYRLMNRRSETVCGFCQRHINPRSRVVAEVGGRTRTVCCAHCAVTEARQEHKPLRLIEVTDYLSGDKLNPEQAWYVDGSRVVACEHDMARMDVTKHAEQLAFDRCSPGTFAFHDRKSAEAFVEQNGGALRRLPELLEEAQ